MNLPKNPTPDQLKTIVQAILRDQLEDDAVVTKLEIPGDKTWTAYYTTQKRSFVCTYKDGYFEKGPVNASESVDFTESPTFAEEEPDTVDLYTDRLRTTAGKEVDGWVNQISGLLDSAGDLNSFSETLLTLYPDLKGDRLRDIMGDAVLAASIAGSLEGDA
jgi:phage gp29-like protein